MKTPPSQLALGTPNMSQEHKSSFFWETPFMKIKTFRLVSAFQDKLVDKSDKSFTNIINHIINTFGEINFENFATMIIKKSRKRGLNIHWKPFINRCGYCDIPYQVIAKAEDFAEDQIFIGKLANIDFKPLGILEKGSLYLPRLEMSPDFYCLSREAN